MYIYMSWQYQLTKTSFSGPDSQHDRLLADRHGEQVLKTSPLIPPHEGNNEEHKWGSRIPLS